MGKIITGFFVISALFCGVILYFFLKNHDQFETMVVSQLKEQFSAYAKQMPEKLKVAEILKDGVTYIYYVDFSDPWSFELIDKKVLVHAPPLKFEPLEGAPEINAARESARIQTRAFIKNWLRTQFEKEKDIEVLVLFPDDSRP